MPKKIITSAALEAHNLIHGARQADYGPAEEVFVRYAAVATVSTGKDITPADVCRVLHAVKTCREQNDPAKRDSSVDGCGYLALLEQLKDAGVADVSVYDQFFPAG